MEKNKSSLQKKLQQVIAGADTLPSPLSHWGQRLLISLGRATWFLRPFPDFLIIGAQKAGTSSLYKYLLQHPSILPAYQKEIHFFTIPNLYFKGNRWYKGHFPTAFVRNQAYQRLLTGEASPSYLFFPLVPERVFKIMPNVKLIVLLRDPVARAFSNYHHQVRRGLETLTFEEAITQEPARLDTDLQKASENPRFHSLNLAHYSYLQRGEYITQIKRWRHFFPAEQILILKSEDLYLSPQKIVSKVSSFLQIPSWQPNPSLFKQYNPGVYNHMNIDIRQRLIKHFKLPNEALYDYLGRDFGWHQ